MYQDCVCICMYVCMIYECMDLIINQPRPTKEKHTYRTCMYVDIIHVRTKILKYIVSAT